MNRGGSFNNAASNARSANRNNNTPENRNNNLGVRPAKTSHSRARIAAAIGVEHTPGPPRRALVMPRPTSRAPAAEENRRPRES